MSNTPQPANPECNHERRPGTTVCLHCRHAAREAAAGRRKKLLLRGSAVGIIIAVVAVTGSLSANVLRGRMASRDRKETPVRVVASTEPAAVATPDTTEAAAPVGVAPANVPVAQQGLEKAGRPGANPDVAPLTPAIAAGQSSLGGDVVAVRTDSAVTLSFDTPDLRTRMPEKFERFLRTTLRQVYGPAVDSALAKVPEGAIATQNSLLYELPTRGLHFPVATGWSLDVYPETRPGQDGPLVIRYRAVVAKN